MKYFIISFFLCLSCPLHPSDVFRMGNYIGGAVTILGDLIVYSGHVKRSGDLVVEGNLIIRDGYIDVDGSLSVIGDIVAENQFGDAYVIATKNIKAQRIETSAAEGCDASICSYDGTVKFKSTCLDLSESFTYLKNAHVMFENDLVLRTELELNGSCTLDGQGHSITFVDDGRIGVNENSHCTLKNVTVKNIETKLFDVSSNSFLFLDSVIWKQCDDFVCDSKEIHIVGDCVFQGYGKQFTLTPETYCAIHPLSSLFIDYNMTFNYNGVVPFNIFMDDETSNLYLNGSTLQVDADLRLTKGTMFLENTVTFSGAPGKTVYFGNSANGENDDLNVELLSDANIDLHCNLEIDNVNT